MNSSPPFWDGLFATGTPAAKSPVVAMKLLKKRGTPLLLLPDQPPLAIQALELYPAQTTRSRLARRAARWLLQLRLPVGVETVQVPLSPDNAFFRWLASWTTQTADELPPFAVLAGNPASPGQRLILLLFDSTGRPAVVVKAGRTEAARALIAQEQSFLEQVPPATPHIPRLRGTFAVPHLQALALEFLPGRSPLAADEPALPRVLRAWLHPRQRIAFAETRVGRELAATSATHPIFKSNAAALQGRTFCAAVYHGDFTPWNVRVAPDGKWRVLDWERGEVNGLPLWDWFHYVVQKGILVEHLAADAVARRLETVLDREEFKAYVRACDAVGAERALLLLHLLHHAEVVRPSEGLRVTSDLMQLLAGPRRLPISN